MKIADENNEDLNVDDEDEMRTMKKKRKKRIIMKFCIRMTIAMLRIVMTTRLMTDSAEENDHGDNNSRV